MEISTLLSSAGKYQSVLTEFLRDLVRIPSVNGRDPEAPLADRIQAELKLRPILVTR